MEKLESLIKTYNDFPKKGIAFKDLLGIIQDSEIFRELILRMSLNHVIKNSEAIISIEARGFIFGSAISLQARKPMIVARKPGKLPGKTFQENYDLEYGSNSLSIEKEALSFYSKISNGSVGDAVYFINNNSLPFYKYLCNFFINIEDFNEIETTKIINSIIEKFQMR